LKRAALLDRVNLIDAAAQFPGEVLKVGPKHGLNLPLAVEESVVVISINRDVSSEAH
jgi:hypothetical protein